MRPHWLRLKAEPPLNSNNSNTHPGNYRSVLKCYMRKNISDYLNIHSSVNGIERIYGNK